MLWEAIADNETIIVNQYGNLMFWDLNSEDTLKITIDSGENSSMTGFVSSALDEISRVELIYDDGKYVMRYHPDKKTEAVEIKTDCNACHAPKMAQIPIDRLSRKRLYECLDESRAMVKTTLMDQKKIFGIGNEFSDEVLYQAGIFPKKKASELTAFEKEAIYDCLLEVYETASKKRISLDQYPSTFLTPIRYKGVACPMCAGRIACMKVSGYDCYFCRDHQHK